MKDEKYQRALKEVNDILENTEEELVKKIPQKMIKFIQNNMDINYETSIEKNKRIDQQKLLPETEEILSLLFRSYWATEEEKELIAIKDKKQLEEEERKKEQEIKNTENIFENRKNNSSKNIIEKQLMVVEEKSIFQKILDKIKAIFKQKRKAKLANGGI